MQANYFVDMDRFILNFILWEEKSPVPNTIFKGKDKLEDWHSLTLRTIKIQGSDEVLMASE
jgi:hypothetical protein